jgi:DNA uptake protein ComE-like DNA-binding protein
LDHLEARDRISDHVPVYIGINGARLVPQLAEGVDARGGAVTQNCIDLNVDAATRLDDQPHVGPARAEAIIAGRPWAATGDLTAIHGIGGGRLDAIRNSGLVCGG